jgi:F-type H+-transporting ATPase subunit b
MPQLNTEFYISQLFWLFIIFTSMYIFVKTVFIPRISSVVDSRSKSIKKNILLAEGILEKNKHIKAEIQQILDKVRNEASSLKISTLKEVELYVAKTLYNAERDIQKRIAKNDEKLARYKVQLHSEVEQIAKSLSKEIYIQIFKNIEVKNKRIAN